MADAVRKNRILTSDEFVGRLVKPLLAAARTDELEAKNEARIAFARGEKTYPTTVFGFEIVYTPENING